MAANTTNGFDNNPPGSLTVWQADKTQTQSRTGTILRPDSRSNSSLALPSPRQAGRGSRLRARDLFSNPPPRRADNRRNPIPVQLPKDESEEQCQDSVLRETKHKSLPKPFEKRLCPQFFSSPPIAKNLSTKHPSVEYKSQSLLRLGWNQAFRTFFNLIIISVRFNLGLNAKKIKNQKYSKSSTVRRRANLWPPVYVTSLLHPPYLINYIASLSLIQRQKPNFCPSFDIRSIHLPPPFRLCMVSAEKGRGVSREFNPTVPLRSCCRTAVSRLGRAKKRGRGVRWGGGDKLSDHSHSKNFHCPFLLCFSRNRAIKKPFASRETEQSKNDTWKMSIPAEIGGLTF